MKTARSPGSGVFPHSSIVIPALFAGQNLFKVASSNGSQPRTLEVDGKKQLFLTAPAKLD